MIGDPFSQLNNNYQLFLSTVPMAVYSTVNPDDESEDQFIAIRDRFVLLPENTKDKLASLELANEIKKIGDENKLKISQMASIARTIRSYYFGDIKLEMFPTIYQKEMEIDQDLAQRIAGDVDKRIIQRNFSSNEGYEISDKVDVKKEEEKTKKKIQLSLSEALQKYPKLGDQIISSSQLTLRYSSNPVSPSIKNWIKDFRDNMGSGKHNAIDRGNYIFHSENGKKLMPTERQKLSAILKSLEEQTVLKIDEERQNVVFDQLATSSPPVSRQFVSVDKNISMEQNGKNDLSASKKWLEKGGNNNQKIDLFSGKIMSGVQQGASLNRKPEIYGKQPIFGNEQKTEKIEENKQIGNDNKDIFQRYAGISPNFKNVEKLHKTNAEGASFRKGVIVGKLGPESKEEKSFFQKLSFGGGNRLNKSSDAEEKNKTINQAPVGGKMTFSSPQKFSAEKIENSEKIAEKMTEKQKTFVSSQPQAESQVENSDDEPIQKKYRWRMTPSGRSSEGEKTSGTKILGNVIDLRN